MLKIKDNVDLKELKKFGFKEIDEFGVKNYVYHKKECELHISHFRVLFIENYCEHYVYSMVEDEIADTLYDLIKADLVEKVGDDNE